MIWRSTFLIMISLSGTSPFREPKALFIKDKISAFNCDSQTTTYMLPYPADRISLSPLHRAHSSPWTYLLERIHLSFNSLRLYLFLYFEWSPALTVSSICLSVLSMLSSATKKIKPSNDSEFVKRAAGRGPKAFLWSYDDDKAWLS